MQFKTVSQHLLRPMDKLVLKLSVSLVNGRTNQDGYYNIYEQPNANYLTFNLDAAVIFQYKVAGTYDPNQIVRVTDETLYQVNKALQEFYKKLLRPDLFSYYKSGAITCNPRRDDTKTISLKTGGFMELEPGVIADAATNSVLPGVFLYLNEKNNKIELSIDEFEAIMYKLSKLDINGYGMQLVLASELFSDKMAKNSYGGTYKATQKPSTPNIFQKRISQPSVEEVIDNRVKQSTQPSSIDDLL